MPAVSNIVYHTSLIVPTTMHIDAFTDPAHFLLFKGPALKISQLTNLSPFWGLFPGIPNLHKRNTVILRYWWEDRSQRI